MTGNYANNVQERQLLLAALQWHIDHGADEMLVDTPVDRTAAPDIAKIIAKTPPLKAVTKAEEAVATEVMGAAAAIIEAQKLAGDCKTLDALKTAITEFDGISIKKTATNMVFSDGDPASSIMLIGEAPGADEDIQGKPFVGECGQLLDKILASIGLSRVSEELTRSVYMTNVLNWRPPGNRTPTSAEMDISQAFIERHIALVQPKMIIFCGGLAAKTLLKSKDSISKMRGAFHDYKMGDVTIPTMVTYHPAYLLKTPLQKKAVWADMLMLQDKIPEVIK